MWHVIDPNYRQQITGPWVDEFDKHINRAFEYAFNPSSISTVKNGIKNNSGYPKIDSYYVDDKYVIEAAVPGLSENDISVEVKDEINENKTSKYIKISGEKIQTNENVNFNRKELKKSSFSRLELLPEDIEGDPEAKVKDGLLTLVWNVRKKISVTPKEFRKIELKSG